jgi:phenylalanyl-tRNA synthetase beta chain
VRRAGVGETAFTTLDDGERALTSDMLMICDAQRPVAIAGVMGGQESEVGDDTVDVLLECALFDPKSIRATRGALVMSTDASYRFERGVDPEGMRDALERAVALILATAGGSVDGAALDVRPRTFEPGSVPLRLARIERVLGVALGSEKVRALLEPLGFGVEGEDDGTLMVRVPGFRSYDVTREVDLIEEVARTHGYDAFPEELGSYRPNTVPDHPMFQLEDEVRNALVGHGLFEAHTPAFVPEGEGDVEVANPLNTLEPFIRRAVLPSLLRRVEYNLARGNRDVRLFEIATSFRRAGSGEAPLEENHLAVVLTGLREPSHWSAADAPIDVWDLKTLVDEMAARVYRGQATVSPAEDDLPGFEPGVAFVVRDGEGREVGHAGRVRPDLVDAPVWAGDVWALELALPEEVVPAPVPVYRRLPQYPAVERDLALLVPDRVPAKTVLDAIRSRGGGLLEDVSLFDHYRGEGVPGGARSVAFGS